MPPAAEPMVAASSIYRSRRMAAAYAFTRPPVHRHVLARARRYFVLPAPVRCALDIGCGAGASTAALMPFSRRTVGVEPHASMLEHAVVVAPGAAFCVGRAEALPFADSAFELLTTAGALNYADVPRSLAEAARLLAPDGLFVAYDFSTGRRIRGDARLGRWFGEFRTRFPSPQGYELDLRKLDYAGHGLDPVGFEELEIAIPMSPTAYLDYVLGDTSVESALSRGESEQEIRRFCEEGLGSIFSSGPREIVFDAEFACARKESLP